MPQLLQFRSKKPGGDKWLQNEAARHHVYGDELLLDGFVSPLVLPSVRLRELKGDSTMSMFADETGLSEAELDFLLENEQMEPTTNQLMTISKKTGCSIMWLLGYHVPPERHIGDGGSEIFVALAKRNAAEATLAKTSGDGFINGLMKQHAQRRVADANLKISAAAAKIVAKEHYPLEEVELEYLHGQPVYVEFEDEAGGAWGISATDHIMMVDGPLSLVGNGTDYQVFLTPRVGEEE